MNDKFKGRTPSAPELLAEVERLKRVEKELNAEIERLRSGDVILFGVREIVAENVELRKQVAELEQLATDAYLQHQLDGGAP